MIIDKKIKKEIKRSYFFYKGIFENINSDYFINKIEEGINGEDNLSYKTNLNGRMTDWQFFTRDLEFEKLLWQLLDVVDRDIKPNAYVLREAWGFKNSLGDYTYRHDHIHDNIFLSGVIYLNKHSQVLEFDEINQKIEPEKGGFAFFSSFLYHGCKRNLIDKPKYGLSFNLNYVRR